MSGRGIVGIIGPEGNRDGGLEVGEGDGIGTEAEDGESAGRVHRQWWKGYAELGVIIEHF